MELRKERNRILIVDDSPLNRAILSDMLSNEYEILEAQDGEEALQLIHDYEDQLSLILLDVIMPKLDGFEVLAFMNKYHWIEEIPVIMISAENSHSIIERAYELGATDYINRPFDEVIVLRRVINTIMLYKKQRNLVSMVADQVYETERSNNLMVSILSHIVEFRNGESGLHVLHIGTITYLILKQLASKTTRYNLTFENISLIAKASAFHDIGKIAIDEKILNKPARLTADEFEIIKTHAKIGAQMLSNLPCYANDELVKLAYQICRWHHERYDGSGYPDGLVGDNIPIAAQAVSIADAYDALISERVYKKAYSHETALQMIINGECGSFNPLLLECLVEIKDIIAKELTICSFGQVSNREIDTINYKLMSDHSLTHSSRTLNLLHDEHIRYKFYSSLSSDIQFEYCTVPCMLTLSQWGSHQLNIPSVILNPLKNPTFVKLIDSIDLRNILELIRNTHSERPYIKYELTLTINNESLPKLLVARTIWNPSNPNEYSSIIGKLIDCTSATYHYIQQLKK